MQLIEKVMFESLMKKLENKEISSQMINPPIILSLSMSESQLLEKYLENFKKYRFSNRIIWWSGLCCKSSSIRPLHFRQRRCFNGHS